jgi:outer membrane protein assembly factor BamB
MTLLKQVLVIALLLGVPLLAQTPNLEHTVVRFPMGSGIVISSDGLIAVPRQLAKPSTSTLDGQKQPAKVALTTPESPFGLMKIGGGPYFTFELGDCSLINDGDQVILVTTGGKEQVRISQQLTDVANNHQVLTVERPYDDTLLGCPLLDDQLRAVALITGPEPGAAGRSRATSVQELKLLLFDGGLPPLISRPHPGPGGGLTTDGQPVNPDGTLAPSQLLEWDFPLGLGSDQRPGDLLLMEEWRQSTGFGGGRIAPLVVDSQQRLYLATLSGTVYCLDVANKQMAWRGGLGPEGVVTSAPLLTNSQLMMVNGNLGLHSTAVRRTGVALRDLFQDIAGRAQNRVSANVGQVYSFNPQTGEEIWRLPSRFLSAPLLDGNTLYLSGLGLLASADTLSGGYKWILDERQRGDRALWYSLQAQERNVLYGVRVPVRVHGGLESEYQLHLKGDDNVDVVAIDALDGKEFWSTELKNTGDLLQPLGAKLRMDNGVLHVIVHDRSFGVDPETGDLRYSYLRSDRALLDRLTIQDGAVFGADDEGWYAVEAATGKFVWRYPAPQSEVAPLIADGVLYGMGHHSLVALDAKTGEKRWEQPFAHRLDGQPAIRDKYLYCASSEGKIWRVTLP